MPATPAAIAALLDGSAITTTSRDVVTVEGPEAERFLQGQLSQDVAGLAPGASALSFLLEPQGRVVALLRVTRAAADAFRLDVDAGAGPSVLARLQRYKLRTKADLTLIEGASFAAARSAALPRPEDALDLPWPGLSGWDLPIDGATRALPGGRVVPPSALDGVRVAALVPAAQDLDERTIPAETGLVEASASFTKGCYTGQELVARMDSRGGRGPRRLVRLVGEGPPPEAGSELRLRSDEPGEEPAEQDVDPDAPPKSGPTVTTVVPTEDGWAGLALLPRRFKEGDELVVGDGGSAVVDR